MYIKYIVNCSSVDHNIHSKTGVGVQSTLGGKTFLPEKYVWKIHKMPEFYMIRARKNYQYTRIFMISARTINKIPKFYTIFAPKMPEFYITVARKLFFPNLGEGARAPAPVSYAYAVKRR